MIWRSIATHQECLTHDTRERTGFGAASRVSCVEQMNRVEQVNQDWL